MSYVAYVTAEEGATLLGGGKRHESSRFQTFGMANGWLYAVLRGNREANRAVKGYGWRKETADPEITEDFLLHGITR